MPSWPSINGNLGRPDLREKAATMALQHANRMTPRERLYTEGQLYSGRRETLDRPGCLPALHRPLSRVQGCRHNLALLQAGLGQLDESSRNFEELIRRGGTFPATFAFLAGNYLALDRADKALETARRYSTRNPENSSGHAGVATVLLGLRRYDEAVGAFARGAVLDPTAAGPGYGQVIALTLQDDWNGAQKVAASLAGGDNDDQQWLGAMALTNLALFGGRATEARQWAERAMAAYDAPVPRAATAQMLRATVEAAAGRGPAALALAQPALARLKGLAPEGAAVIGTATLLAQSGRIDEATNLLDAYAATSTPATARVFGRTVAHGRGAVALAAKDSATAIRELTAAQSSLSARPHNPTAPSNHVGIWFALGAAHLGAANPNEARPWFDRSSRARTRRGLQPLEFVRSLYYLATIEEAAGNGPKALDYYRRFVGYWGDGEIDRDKVEIARRKLRANRSTCLACQAGCQGRWALTMALRMVRSLCIAATRATFGGLPAPRRRW